MDWIKLVALSIVAATLSCSFKIRDLNSLLTGFEDCVTTIVLLNHSIQLDPVSHAVIIGNGIQTREPVAPIILLRKSLRFLPVRLPTDGVEKNSSVHL